MRRLASGEPRPFQRWLRLRLSAQAAAKFTNELGDLLARYDHANVGSGRPHLCYFALVKS